MTPITPDATGQTPHDESHALALDASDPLRRFRERFHIPKRPDGSPVTYFAGHSLGLQPKTTAAAIQRELNDWAAMGVDGHFKKETPWYSYHELLREPLARLVGAHPDEVAAMNSLTVNLHLMMVTFYRPTRDRHKIVMEDAAFPSDTYAVKSQLRYHGFDPADGMIVVKPRPGEFAIRTDDVEQLLRDRGHEIALVMLGGVNYFTGQLFDMPRIAAAAKSAGCVVGYDLAHAAGNVPVALHDWGVDFAVWCSYKYLNGGPGAVAGCFVHRDHGANADLHRFAGWWGNDPKTRFRMHLQPEFVPRPGADGWQISNPPIFSLAPVAASLALFDEAGMVALRDKSRRLTGYMCDLLDRRADGVVRIITPREPDARGCQISMLVNDHPRERLSALHAAGVVCDFREPNVLRAAPVPLYNTFHDVWRFVQALARTIQ
ncbi:MAG: kynureninase [Phycisphaerales bacterium]|nr:kynureninase [Phycisphaerales bacterium]